MGPLLESTALFRGALPYRGAETEATMRSVALLVALLTGACATSGRYGGFQTEDVLQLDRVPPDALERIAKAGEADGWSLSGIHKSQSSLSFERVVVGTTVFGRKFQNASIYCTLDGNKLQIAYQGVGNYGAAERESVQEELDHFKKRVLEALG
jgi:surface antigen